MREHQTKFIVAGRLVDEQFRVAKPDEVLDEGQDGEFYLDQQYIDMFTYLTEDDFRIDLSSTQLRNANKGL